MSNSIRVRFAPSPSGYLHVGGARTALFNWLLARRHGGAFILRVEDTDAERSSEESVASILDGMRWLGLDWDEGPFYQSDRLDLYRQEADRLLREGKAYRCFCSIERLDALREQARAAKANFRYDGLCREIDPAESQRRAEAGESFVLRLKVGDDGPGAVEDLIRGTVKTDRSLIDDFVLTRTNGRPTFNFANVVDDHAMGVTHVVRGEDHLPNTPRHQLLYRALGYEEPKFAHLPMILGPDKQKLSKRHGAVSVLAYKDEGMLPEAMMNFLALLGWSLDDKTDQMPVARIIANFSLERINKSAAVFDVEKLAWLNGAHLRALPPEEAVRRVRGYMAEYGPDPAAYDPEWLAGVIALFLERARTLKSLVEQMAYFLSDEFPFDEKAVEKHLRKEGAAEMLEAAEQALAAAPDFSHRTLEAAMQALVDRLQCSFSKIAHPCRVALTGLQASPGIFDVIACLGRERTLKRLAYARENLCARH